MELFVLGVVALAIYAFIRAIATGTAILSGSRYRAYRQLAARFRGRYESRGMAEPPTVSFAHNGSSVRVGLAPQVPGQPAVARTRVVARFATGLPIRLELAPTSRPAPPQPPKGTRLVRLGEPSFDREYVVQANDPEIAREFLSQPVRWAVDALQRLGPPGGILVSINPERLLVQVDRNLGYQFDALAGAVQLALAIHDGLGQAVSRRVSEGIEIVSAGPPSAEVVGPPTCKVCGEPISGELVLCTACKTPHHRDCWEFVGGCSIFGCQSKRSIPA